MGDIRYSEQQMQVINTRGKNILVSAAAGSGKTTVLVERIIRKITDKNNPVDIDRILVLTYTEAAAGEMRRRIEDAIDKAIEEEPDNEQLLRQAVLIHNAQISTIHGFCLSLIRNNFADIGIDPSFRVAETGEIKLVEGQVAEELIEELFESDNPRQIELLADRFSSGNTLKGLKEIILKSYSVCRNNPFVREYIEDRKKDYDYEDGEELLNTCWGKELSVYAAKIIDEAMKLTKYNLELTKSAGGAFMYSDALQSDIDQIENIKKCRKYEEYQLAFRGLEYARLSTKKSPDVDDASKELSKSIRNSVKDMLSALENNMFSMSADAVVGGMKENKKIVQALAEVLLLFDTKLEEEKQKRKIIDFSDMEHYAIKVLLKKEGEKYIPTKTALDYRDFYDEIMVDEYQDSNVVQEKMLEAISGEAAGRFNRFMVGDVKQSIYSFRNACPELFMEKYETYKKEDDRCVRIDLSANYRSREEVVDSVNHVFEKIMGKDMGNIAYDETASLNANADYPKTDSSYNTELLLMEYFDGEESKQEQEAMLVATQIQKLVGKYNICDKEGVRPCKYRDIVILLRSNKGWDDTFKKVLESYGIPVFISSKTGYFSAIEIKKLLNLLQVLDNPRNEIELYGILTDIFGGFEEDEIARLRIVSKEELYEIIRNIADGKYEDNDLISDEIRNKCSSFIQFITRLRAKVIYTPINELLEEIIEETGYMYHVASLPYGDRRKSNVYMLIEKAKQYESGSFKGLYHFIRYINEIQSYEVDYGEASMVDEQADVVRIMSIHKSKGLEFPICFLSGLSKKFNLRDTYATLLFEKELGIGLEYIDVAQSVKHTDIKHKLLSTRMKLDDIAEEMRVLYVAMTRAKEKMIMTACVQDPETLIDKYEVLRSMAENEEGALLPYYVRSAFSSYLDILLYAVNKSINVSTLKKEELEKTLVMDGVSRQKRKRDIERILKKSSKEEYRTDEVFNNVKNKIMFKYPHKSISQLYTKTTVSELKMAAIYDKVRENDLEELPAQFFAEHETEQYIPTFIECEKKVGGAARGSAYHKVMELYDFAGSKDIERVDCKSQEDAVINAIETMIRQGRIDREVAELVDVKKLVLFLCSDLGRRMCRADIRGELSVEQPFVLGINADRLNSEFPKDETVLIQGIIDVFFVEDGKIILMDYKTDAVKSKEALVERYQLQLDYYKEALERITKMKVAEKLIYSFALNETIRLD